jgi:hypothetical protein
MDAMTNRASAASDIDIARAQGAQVPQVDSAQDASYSDQPPGVV